MDKTSAAVANGREFVPWRVFMWVSGIVIATVLGSYAFGYGLWDRHVADQKAHLGWDRIEALDTRYVTQKEYAQMKRSLEIIQEDVQYLRERQERVDTPSRIGSGK